MSYDQIKKTVTPASIGTGIGAIGIIVVWLTNLETKVDNNSDRFYQSEKASAIQTVEYNHLRRELEMMRSEQNKRFEELKRIIEENQSKEKKWN